MEKLNENNIILNVSLVKCQDYENSKVEAAIEKRLNLSAVLEIMSGQAIMSS